MAVRIRLRRMGRKKQPHYRIVVADGDAPRDGRFVEALGYYRPLSEPARLVLDLDRVDYWIGVGARPSNTVGNLIDRARRGGDTRLAVGIEDHDAMRTKRAEELAARRAAEKKAISDAEAGRKAEEAAKKAAAAEAEAEAAKAAEAEAAKAAEAEAEEAGGDDAPTAEAAEATDAAEPDEAADAPAPEGEADDSGESEDEEKGS